jgi:hypothetical protein
MTLRLSLVEHPPRRPAASWGTPAPVALRDPAADHARVRSSVSSNRTSPPISSLFAPMAGQRLDHRAGRGTFGWPARLLAAVSTSSATEGNSGLYSSAMQLLGRGTRNDLTLNEVQQYADQRTRRPRSRRSIAHRDPARAADRPAVLDWYRDRLRLDIMRTIPFSTP